MKLKLIIFILLFYAINLYGENLSNYDAIKIKTIKIGNKEGELGWHGWLQNVGGYAGPSTFDINANGLIYVPDRINKRINVYDLNLNIKKTIIEKNDKKAHNTLKMKVTDKGHLIYLNPTYGLRKIDIQGNLLFHITDNNLPKQIFNMYFALVQDKIVFLDDNQKLGTITETGEIWKEKVTFSFLEKIDKQILTESYLSGTLGIDSIHQQNYLQIINDPRFTVIGERLYFCSFDNAKEYYEKLQPIREYLKFTGKSVFEKKNISIDESKYSIGLIGYDKFNNSYWQAKEKKVTEQTRKEAIIIFSKFGELLDAFFISSEIYDTKLNRWEPDYINYPTSWSFKSVSPDGDIYFMRGSDEGHHFYKIESSW